MFIPWMIETLRPWCAERIIGCMHGVLLNEFFCAECIAKLEIHKHVAISISGNRLGDE
jgi:hypothetical protein